MIHNGGEEKEEEELTVQYYVRRQVTSTFTSSTDQLKLILEGTLNDRTVGRKTKKLRYNYGPRLPIV